jgi:DNA-binding transcriptional LysR family regulator
VSLAASRLRLSQPALSRRLQRLERALGLELFDRRAKPMRPTTTGRRLLEQSRSIIQAVDQFYASGHGPPSGDFRLGVSLTYGGFALASPIDTIRKAFPDVRVQVMTGWSPFLLEQVLGGALDAAFLALCGDPVRMPDGVTAKQLVRTPLVGVAPRSVKLPGVVDVRRLTGAAWVLNPDGCAMRRNLQQALERHGIPLRVSAEVYGWEIQLSLIARGVGFGIQPTWPIRTSPLRTKLRTFRLKGHELHIGFWTARRPGLGRLDVVADRLDTALAAVFRRAR